VNAEMRIELHPSGCSCRGGAWVLMGTASSSCAGGNAGGQAIVIGADEWRNLGKPGTADQYLEVKARAEGGDRREFPRVRASIPVRLARLVSRRSVNPQAEDTHTEVVASGGALVISHMAIEQGETLTFEVPGRFTTKAEVAYVTVADDDGTPCLRVGLRFLDGLLPRELVPADAVPV